MKARSGFVSNSSSTSFLILLPDKFNPEKDFDWKAVDESGYYFQSDVLPLDVVKDIKESLESFLETGNLTSEDSIYVYALHYGLKKFELEEIETGPDEISQISILDKKKIKKILKIK